MDESWAGEWSGRYVNPNAPREDSPPEYGIRIEIRQWGEALSGTMTDLESINAISLAKWLESSASDRLSSLQKKWMTGWLAKYPGLVIESTLPEDSDLVGKVKGREIEFEKTYRGESSTVWREGGREVWRSSTPGHSVRYRGVRSEDRRSIVGTWTIPAPGVRGWLGKDLGRGEFSIHRTGVPG